jgi:hypothetical protein
VTRVVQWATGAVGAVQLREIIDHWPAPKIPDSCPTSLEWDRLER